MSSQDGAGGDGDARAPGATPGEASSSAPADVAASLAWLQRAARVNAARAIAAGTHATGADISPIAAEGGIDAVGHEPGAVPGSDERAAPPPSRG